MTTHLTRTAGAAEKRQDLVQRRRRRTPIPLARQRRGHRNDPRFDLWSRIGQQRSRYQPRKDGADQYIVSGYIEAILLKDDQSGRLVDGEVGVTDVRFDGESRSDVHLAGETPRHGNGVGSDGGIRGRRDYFGPGGFLIEEFPYSPGVIFDAVDLDVGILKSELVGEIDRIDVPGDEPFPLGQLEVQYLRQGIQIDPPEFRSVKVDRGEGIVVVRNSTISVGRRVVVVVVRLLHKVGEDFRDAVAVLLDDRSVVVVLHRRRRRRLVLGRRGREDDGGRRDAASSSPGDGDEGCAGGDGDDDERRRGFRHRRDRAGRRRHRRHGDDDRDGARAGCRCRCC
mmetsp:Transcript_30234/g.90006  ORF Transcript_30234/g.90006 Transcript_30234/m.90006 type:complete len:339 (-) Transcript_30234:183-1199(-)